MLRPGGKLYLYEPLITKDQKRIQLLTFPVVLLIRYSIALSFTKPVKLFNLSTKEYLAEVERGYTGLSRRKRALDYELICEAFSSDVARRALRRATFSAYPLHTIDDIAKTLL